MSLSVLFIVAFSLLANSIIAAPLETNLQPRHLLGGIGGGFNIGGSLGGGGSIAGGIASSIAGGISGIGSAIHSGEFVYKY